MHKVDIEVIRGLFIFIVGVAFIVIAMGTVVLWSRCGPNEYLVPTIGIPVCVAGHR